MDKLIFKLCSALRKIVYRIHLLVFGAPCAYSNIYIGILHWRKLKIIKDKYCSLLKYFMETNAVNWTINISNIGMVLIPNSSLKSHYQAAFFHLILIRKDLVSFTSLDLIFVFLLCVPLPSLLGRLRVAALSPRFTNPRLRNPQAAHANASGQSLGRQETFAKMSNKKQMAPQSLPL